jgi:hypothetical protein
MKKIKLAVANLGEEELYQMKYKVLNRAASRATIQKMFPLAGQKSADKDTKMMKKLFVQSRAAETMAPVLSEINKTAAVDAFFNKIAGLTTAQIRFPELLKAAGPTPTLKRKATAHPVQASITGGSA